MTDVFSKEKRSQVMSAIRSKGNMSTEIALIEVFKQNHITGWRRNAKLTGNPDFVFRKERVIVFVDGCFWHGHNCRKFKFETNPDYWKEKLEKNISRDNIVTKWLRNNGWKVIRIWECEIEKKKYSRKLKLIKGYLANSK